jgi:hypothetical protein
MLYLSILRCFKQLYLFIFMNWSSFLEFGLMFWIHSDNSNIYSKAWFRADQNEEKNEVKGTVIILNRQKVYSKRTLRSFNSFFDWLRFSWNDLKCFWLLRFIINLKTNCNLALPSGYILQVLPLISIIKTHTILCEGSFRKSSAQTGCPWFEVWSQNTPPLHIETVVYISS